MKRPYFRRTAGHSGSNIDQSSYIGGSALRDRLGERSLASVTNLPMLRERILNLILFGSVIAGLITMLINLVTDIPAGNYLQAGIYLLAFGWVLALALGRKLSFSLRAYGILAVPYLLGIVAAVQDGVSGNARIWMMGLAALTGILLGMTSGIVAMVLSALTLVVIGLAFSQGWLPLPPVGAALETGIFWDWLSSSAVFLTIALLVVISLVVLIDGLSSSLEKTKDMADELANDRQQLDQRTRELDRRMVQIRTAAEISRSISAVLDPNMLLQQMADLVRARFDLYYVGVFLLDERNEYAVLRAGTGEAGQQMMTANHQLPIGGASMIGWTIANRKPRIALDVGAEAVRFNNPLLPNTHSEMALPLMSGDQVFGAMTVQSAQQEAFDEDDVIVLQGIADSLATALQNARLFQQEQSNLEEIRALNRQYVVQAWVKGGQAAAQTEYAFVNPQLEGRSHAPATGDYAPIDVPLTLREQVIGNISLDVERNSLLPEDLELIEQVATQAALAMENVRLLEETQRRAGQERLVADIVQKARSTTDVDTILRTTLNELGRALGAADGNILLSIAPAQEVEE